MSTLQRRADAWRAGDRTPYAIRSWRAYGDRGPRLFDLLDVQRVRLQRLGELSPAVTADEYLEQQHR